MNDELQEQVDNLIAERDRLRHQADELVCKIGEITDAGSELLRKQPYTFKPSDVVGSFKTVGMYIDELTAERDELLAELEAYRDFEKGEFAIPLDEAMKFTTDPPGYIKKHIAELQAERDELRGQLDTMRDVAREFRDERNELQSIIDHMPKTEQECEACQDAHDRLMFNAKVDMDELRDELKHKQLVIDRQRDSFLKMERENRELQDVCGELERTVENMRGD